MSHKHTIGYEIKTLDNLFFRNMISYETSRGTLDELTVMHRWILGFLYHNPGRDIFQKDIEREFSIARSTVTSIVKLMEKKGYILRENAAADARLKRLILTEKGKELHKCHIDNIEVLEQRVVRGLSQEEIGLFFSVTAKLKKNLEEDIASS